MNDRYQRISRAMTAGRVLLPALLMLAVGHRANAAALDFTAADFTILNAADGLPIGSVHYDVSAPTSGHQIVTSLARYNDGQSDVERDDFDISKGVEFPVMSAYEHDFHRADGAMFLISKANFVTGDAACTSYANGQAEVLSATIDFPPDSYAGAALMLPLRRSLRTGANAPIVLHDFVCIPGPKVFKVAAYPQAPARWEHYPGDLVRMAMKPDFGWLDYVIAPFVPKMSGWFNPAGDFDFVGGEFSRFYKGPEIIITRKPATPPAATVANRNSAATAPH
jgi:hypothetical protein